MVSCHDTSSADSPKVEEIGGNRPLRRNLAAIAFAKFLAA